MAPASSIQGTLRLIHSALDSALELSLRAKLALAAAHADPLAGRIAVPDWEMAQLRLASNDLQRSVQALEASPYEALLLLVDTSVCPRCHSREPHPAFRPQPCTHPFHAALAIAQQPVPAPPKPSLPPRPRPSQPAPG